MTKKDYKKHCLSFVGASEDYPEDNIRAFKVMDEIFALNNEKAFNGIDLKCDPIKAATLRNLYEEVQPSKYMDKKHWNTVDPKGAIDDEIIKEWIRDSYELAIEDLPRKKQRKIRKMQEKED